MRVLERYHWPGNVRELRNVMERVDDRRQGRVHRPRGPARRWPTRRRAASPAAGGLTPGTTVDEAERQLIDITLQHTGGNKTRAAEMLGISLKTLHNKLNRMKEERQEPDRDAPEHQDQTGRRRHGHRGPGDRVPVGVVPRRRSDSCCSRKAASGGRVEQDHLPARLHASSPSRGPAVPRVDPVVRLQTIRACRPSSNRAGVLKNVLYAAIVDADGEIVAHSDPSRIGQPLEPAEDLAKLIEKGGAIAQLRAIATRHGKTFEVSSPLLLGTRTSDRSASASRRC